MPAPAAPAVEVTGLVKAYGARHVVDDLSLTAARGQVTAVLGPNGAGKTTTVECCEGLRRPDSGRVRVLGADPVDAPAGHRARVGVMLQGGGLPTAARAVELVRHVSRLHRHPLDPDGLAERLGITEFASTPVRRLSGGQRQRVALACAMVGRPEVLFLDEPSAGLDPQARLSVWDLVRQARQAGVAVVLTTHLIDEAERLADLVVVMDAGRVVAEGSPAELTGGTGGTGGMEQAHADTVRFRAAPSLDLSTLRSVLPGDLQVTETPPGLYEVGGRIDPRVLVTITTWCAEQHLMPEGLTVGRRSLEDVFLDLTGRSLR